MKDEPDVVETATSFDGWKRWHLSRRKDGFFTYEEESFFREDLGEFGGLAEYWNVTYSSGLFDTEDAARREALVHIAWLKEAISRE